MSGGFCATKCRYWAALESQCTTFLILERRQTICDWRSAQGNVSILGGNRLIGATCYRNLRAICAAIHCAVNEGREATLQRIPATFPVGLGCQCSSRFLAMRIARLKVSLTDRPCGRQSGTDPCILSPRSQLITSQLLRQELVEFLVREKLLFIDRELLLFSVAYSTIRLRRALINLF